MYSMVCSGNIFWEIQWGNKNVKPNSWCPLRLLHRVASWASTILASSELKYILGVLSYHIFKGLFYFYYNCIVFSLIGFIRD